MTKDKVLPYDLEIEEAVVGACLLEKDAFIKVAPFLKPLHFYLDKHSTIYNAIISLFDKNEPIDTMTVLNELKRTKQLEEVGGAMELMEMTNNISQTWNVETHARIIQQHYIARELIRINLESSNKLYSNADPIAVLNETAKNLSDLFDIGSTKKAVLLKTIIEHDEHLQTLPDIVKIKTGFQVLDKAILGFQPPDLIVLGARPGLGKTSFALSCVRALGMNNVPCAIFSLEMSALQLESRLVSIEAQVNNEKYRKRELNSYDKQRVKEAYVKLKTYPIYIDDSPGLSITELKAKATALKLQHNIKVVFVDYIQLMSGEGKNRAEVVSAISRGLKCLAKELDVPVIALSQLNRASEDSKDKKPSLGHLKESSGIEENADIVIFLYRYSYFKIANDKDGNPIPEDYAEGLIEKNRNGRTGVVPLRWIGATMTYTDYEQTIDNQTEPMPF